MLVLDVDIKQIAAPLVGKHKAEKFAVLKSPISSESDLVLNLTNKLDVIILAVEGSFRHLKELDKEKSKRLLKDTNETIEDFYSFDDLLSERNFFNNQDLKKKVSYLFKALYKFESLLHKNTYKDTPIDKTPPEIADNISKLNKRNLSKLIK